MIDSSYCKEMYKKLLFIILSIALIIINYSLYINQQYSLNNTSDEFGYISNAMYIANGEEQKITSLWGNYYSYGYSFLIAPLIKLFKDIDSVYLCVMCINIAFLIIAFLLSIKCCEILFKDMNYALNIVICLANILFTSNLVYAKWVWPESLIVLLYWLCVYLVIKLESRDEIINKYTIALITTLIYSYTVHQRTLVMSIAALMSIFYMIVVEKKKLAKNHKINILLVIGYIALLLVGTRYIKGQILIHVYGNNLFSAANNMTGIVNSVSSKITFDGIRTFIYGLCGKVWYFIVSTFFIGCFGSIYCGEKILSDLCRKEKKSNHFVASYAFILLCFIGSLLLNTIFMWGNYERHDTLIYGRYMEYTFGGLLLCGFYEIYKNRIKNIRINVIITTIILIFTSIVVSHVWAVSCKNYYKSMFSSAIVGYFFPLPEDLGSIPLIISLVRTNIVLIFLAIICFSKKTKVIVLTIASICTVIWVYHGAKYNEGAYNYQNYIYDTYAPMRDIVQNAGDDRRAYIIYDANDEEININEQRKIARLQVMAYDKPIEPLQVQLIDRKNMDKEGIYIISQKAYDLSTIKELMSGFAVVFENEEWIIYANNNE